MSQGFANNPKTGMTFEETASEWLAAKKPQVQPSTCIKYRNIPPPAGL